jgi:hypothetical protein
MNRYTLFRRMAHTKASASFSNYSLFLFHLMTLPAAQIVQRRMMGWSGNDEPERMS